MHTPILRPILLIPNYVLTVEVITIILKVIRPITNTYPNVWPPHFPLCTTYDKTR